MAIIFDKHCVTNEHARVPTRSARVGRSQDANVVTVDGDEEDSGCKGDDYVTPVLGGKGKGKPKRACPYSPSPATKKAKEESPTEVQRLLSIMESRSKSKHSATSQVTVNPPRQELRDMVAQVVQDGGSAGSNEHFYATQLFMQQEYRDAFTTFENEAPEVRLEWLRRTWEHHNKNEGWMKLQIHRMKNLTWPWLHYFVFCKRKREFHMHRGDCHS